MKVQLDMNRGLRHTPSLYSKEENSLTTLYLLLVGNKNRENIRVSTFSPIDSAGPLQVILSNTGIREVQGIFHTKFMVFDNSVILTGANLSEEYFLSRKDRYILINDVPELADYLEDYMDIFAECTGEYTAKKSDFREVVEPWSLADRVQYYYGIRGNLLIIRNVCTSKDKTKTAKA